MTPKTEVKRKCPRINNYMKKYIIIIVTIGFTFILLVCPLVESTPLAHTVEPWYSSAPTTTLVAPITGSYAPVSFYNHTGSWN